ncbi:MAG TPA: hypothetical protein DDZ51_27185 [Planctomycetaceae bacterium]|nr:hypothetical protein [Planctomycetaceae bacterium]
MVDCPKTKLYQNQGAPCPDLFLAESSFKFPNPLNIEVSTRWAGDGERIVPVDKVDAGGLGAVFGLQRHDYFVSVNGRPVDNVDDYFVELQRARG